MIGLETMVVDAGFWWTIGCGFVMGWCARSVLLWVTDQVRRERELTDRLRDQHPSRYPLHRAEVDEYAARGKW